MKKIFGLAMVAVMVLGLGAAFAQPAAGHDVNIRIPRLLMLRITDGLSNNAATSPSVEFDFQADATDYIAAVNAGGGTVAPTTVTDFGDVVVLANAGGWSVGVSSGVLSFIDNLAVGGTGAGIALTDITVAPSGAAGANVTPTGGFNLSGATVANGSKTTGWESLGFSGGDYGLTVDGDEDPGEYSTTVTYTITAP